MTDPHPKLMDAIAALTEDIKKLRLVNLQIRERLVAIEDKLGTGPQNERGTKPGPSSAKPIH